MSEDLAETIEEKELLELLKDAPIYENKGVSTIRKATRREEEVLSFTWNGAMMINEEAPWGMWIISEVSPIPRTYLVDEDKAKSIIAESIPLTSPPDSFIEKKWVRAIPNPMLKVPEVCGSRYYLKKMLFPAGEYMLVVRCGENGAIKKAYPLIASHVSYFERYYSLKTF
jgi:hypothetical protein